eukprot:UN27445
MYAAIASGVTLLIMFYIYQKSFELDWGTIPDALTEYQVVKRLYGLSHLTEVSSYRPHFLILSGDPNNRKGLVYFGQCLKKGYGALIYGNVHIGNYKTFYERQIKIMAIWVLIIYLEQKDSMNKSVVILFVWVSIC